MSGVLGIYGKDVDKISQMMYYGLYALQHRGQIGTGIAINNNGFIDYYKDLGLVNEVYKEEDLKGLRGNISIGQVRFAFAGQKIDKKNIEPLTIGYKNGALGIAHDGNIANYRTLKESLEEMGSIFQTDLDSEVIANLIARSGKKGIVESVEKVLGEIEGSYSLVIMTKDKLIGARDSYGIKPLSLGKIGDNYVISSETCAFDTLGAEFIRDIEAGEMLIIDDTGMKSIYKKQEARKFCAFESIYFARPDSIIDGKSIYLSRINMGKALFKEAPVDADIVIGAPDSGIIAAIGYSQASNIPYEEGLIKNRYVGRTFISPTKELREQGVRIKLNVLKENIVGKRVILVDDSIVRGTTIKRTVEMLKAAGAKEIHIRIASPSVTNSCHLGMDTPNRKNLIGANKTVKEIEESIGADSLYFLSTEGLLESIGDEGFCTGCFTGNYPIGKDGEKMSLTYKDSGVDKEAGYKQVELIKKSIEKTHSANVLSSIGGFSGLFKLDMEGMKEPVLVSGTDGVGTKLKLAFMTDNHKTIGEDLVAMCANDILCQGAKPLFFLDYIGTGKLEPEKMAEVVEGVSNGCLKAQCALIGGETAEMPGFYKDGEYDLAGFCVGVVDRENIIDGSSIEEGDIILGLPSSGIHSNGYSLVRKIVFEREELDLNQKIEGLEGTLGEELLKATRIYVDPVLGLTKEFDIKGLVHITGGGFYENIPRVLPQGLSAHIDKKEIDIPYIFDLLKEWASLDEKEMYSTFNMGVGMIIILAKEESEKVISFLNGKGEKVYKLGRVEKGNEGVVIC